MDDREREQERRGFEGHQILASFTKMETKMDDVISRLIRLEERFAAFTEREMGSREQWASIAGRLNSMEAEMIAFKSRLKGAYWALGVCVSFIAWFLTKFEIIPIIGGR